MDLKQDIYNMIKQINNEKDLKEIAELCKQKTAITLDEYIDTELQCAPNNVKNKFKCEVVELYYKINKEIIRIDKNPCGDWCDLNIEGLLLDDWIGGYYPVFNPLRLAICIYKIWKKEIVFE